MTSIYMISGNLCSCLLNILDLFVVFTIHAYLYGNISEETIYFKAGCKEPIRVYFPKPDINFICLP